MPSDCSRNSTNEDTYPKAFSGPSHDGFGSVTLPGLHWRHPRIPGAIERKRNAKQAHAEHNSST